MSYSTVKQWTTAIADAIRAKDGTSAQINHEDFPTRISAITSGNDWEKILSAETDDETIEIHSDRTNCSFIVPSKMFLNYFHINNRLKHFIIDAPNAASVEIGTYAFQNCSALEEVNIPTNQYQYLYNYAFLNCSALKTVKMPYLATIYGYAFQNAGDHLSTEYMPAVTTINSNAFQGASVEKIIFPLVTQLPSYTFASAKDIKEINLPAVTSIGTSAFSGATFDATAKPVFPAVTTIGQTAFKTSNLKYIDLPVVSSIGKNAFNGVSGLTCIIRSSAVPTIQSDSFPVGTIFYVQDSLISSYQSATNWAQHSANIHGLSEV